MLEEVKEYLRITWSDDDFLLARLIERGKKKLEELMGAALDFEDEGLARSLLFDYVRYAYNNASEYFEENFRFEILRLQLMVGIKEMKADAETEG